MMSGGKCAEFMETEATVKPDDLRIWMNRMGYDKRQAAESIGVSVRQIERYLDGTRGIPETVARLAACLERERG